MGRIFPSRKKQNRYERQEEQRRTMQARLAGTGLYVFRNHNRGSLDLPKPAKDMSGKVVKHVQPGAEFMGDSYFMGLVRTHECTFVRTLENPVSEEPKAEPAPKGQPMIEEKLILDQPDKITTEGKVEHVVAKKSKKAAKLNETPQQAEVEPTGDVLINENPLDGVEILG